MEKDYITVRDLITLLTHYNMDKKIYFHDTYNGADDFVIPHIIGYKADDEDVYVIG